MIRPFSVLFCFSFGHDSIEMGKLVTMGREEIILSAKPLNKREGFGSQVKGLLLHGNRGDLYCERKNYVNNKVTGG